MSETPLAYGSPMPIEGFLDRLRQTLSLVSHKEIIEFLGITRQTYNKRRRTGAIPKTWMETARDVAGLNPTWAETGAGEQFLDKAKYVAFMSAKHQTTAAPAGAIVVTSPAPSLTGLVMPRNLDPERAMAAHNFPIPRALAAQYGLNPDSLAWLRAQIDIPPVINRGDRCLVAMDRTTVIPGRIYAITLGETPGLGRYVADEAGGHFALGAGGTSHAPTILGEVVYVIPSLGRFLGD